MITLRPYQEECLQAINEAFHNGTTRQLIHLPTAAGKTVIFASLTKQMQRKTLVLAHTTELLAQAKDKLSMICPELDIGLVKADHKEYDRPVVVSTIQSARQPNTLEILKKQGFSLCIYDEAHRSCSRTSREVLSALGFFDTPGYLLTGFSATPWTNGSKGLGEIFDKVVYHKSIKDLIALGYLCKPVGIKIKTDLDLTTVQTEDGDFRTESLASVMNTDELIRVAVDSWMEQAHDRKTIAFGVTVSHAQNLAEEFKRRGVSAEAIHGGTPTDERESILERFKNGAISILSNCLVLTEGFDAPDVSCILMARPTQSKGLYTQCVGRGLRLYPNKSDCLILDFGSTSHSLCGTAVLVGDTEEETEQKQPEGRMIEFAKGLPVSINKKLKASIIEFDLLGDSFTWLKDGPSYSLKASGDKTLKILPTAQGRFNVVFFDGNTSQTIVQDLSFEYGFSSAEEFVKANRSLFTISDLEAPWRALPISEKQKGLFRSFGYKAGIADLTRGQASTIISSGVLRRKAVVGRSLDVEINNNSNYNKRTRQKQKSRRSTKIRRH